MSGAKGGCYYLNSSGNKTYVDKKFCNGISNSNSVSETKPSNKNKDSVTAETNNKATAKAVSLFI